MTDFERAIVRRLNDYFQSDEHPYPTGYAKRDQQNEYQKQVTDVMVFKPDVFIECKALKTNSTGGVGFTTHFNQGEDGEPHQIKRATDLLNRTGFKGVLALELRHGRGKEKECYLIDWHLIYQRWNDDEAMQSVRFHELEDYTETDDPAEAPLVKKVPREGRKYHFSTEIFEWMLQIHG